jgi:hypothetical protein
LTKMRVLERKLEKMKRELESWKKSALGVKQRDRTSFMQVDESEQSLVVTYGEDNEMDCFEPQACVKIREISFILLIFSKVYDNDGPLPSTLNSSTVETRSDPIPPLTHNLENVPSTPIAEITRPTKKFCSTWNLTIPKAGKKVVNSTLPLKLDAKGHVLGNAVLGSRMKMEKKMLDRI